MDTVSEASAQVVLPDEASVRVVDELNEKIFLSDKLSPILVCGPPRSGKTTAIKNILHINDARLCNVIVITATLESWGGTGAIVKKVNDPAQLSSLLDTFEEILSDPTQCITALVLDDFLHSSDVCSRFSRVSGDLIARAHQVGLLVIVGVHEASHIMTKSIASFGIVMHCGEAILKSNALKNFWERCCISRWPQWQGFLDMYTNYIKDRGQYIVLQKTGDVVDTYYWRPAELKQPIVIRPELADANYNHQFAKWCNRVEPDQSADKTHQSLEKGKIAAFQSLFASWGIPFHDATTYAKRLVGLDVAIEDLSFVTEQELKDHVGVTLLGHLVKFRRYLQENLPIRPTWVKSSSQSF